MNRLRRKKVQRLLDVTRPLFARRPMQISGVVVGVGEEVRWQELGVSKRRLEMWFRLRKISHHARGEQQARRDAVEKDRQDRLEDVVSITDEDGLRVDGPTIQQWIASGYLPENYPPEGYAIVDPEGYLAYMEALTAPGEDSKE